MSYYQNAIREDLAALGFIGKYDPRHVEGWMRLELGTLDALDKVRFRREVSIAVQCIDASTTSENEQLATSYGL